MRLAGQPFAAACCADHISCPLTAIGHRRDGDPGIGQDLTQACRDAAATSLAPNESLNLSGAIKIFIELADRAKE